MVKRIDDKGGIYHEPPYTWEEEQELYRIMSPQPGAQYIHAGPRGLPPQTLPPPPEVESRDRPGPASPGQPSQDHSPQSCEDSADPPG